MLIRKSFLSNHSAQRRSDGKGGKKGVPPNGPLESKGRYNECFAGRLAQSAAMQLKD